MGTGGCRDRLIGGSPPSGGTRLAGQTGIRKRPIGGANGHPRGSLSAGSDAHPEASDRRPFGACSYRRRCAECSPLKFIGGSSQTVMGVRGGHSGVGDLRSSARRDGNICVLCMIWRPRTGLGALPGKNFTQCIPKQRFAGFLDTPHANLAKTSSFWIHIGYMLPRRGVFSVLGPFWDASSENLATVE